MVTQTCDTSPRLAHFAYDLSGGIALLEGVQVRFGSKADHWAGHIADLLRAKS
jgi:hypothetical protein